VHLLRLLISGTALVETGRLHIDVGPHRERLLAVRRGEVPWPEIRAWRDRLAAQLEAAAERGPLPEHPDEVRVDDWLVSVRRRSLAEEDATP
jgi:uncharacterized protein